MKQYLVETMPLERYKPDWDADGFRQRSGFYGPTYYLNMKAEYGWRVIDIKIIGDLVLYHFEADR